jgi:hypothetical protein
MRPALRSSLAILAIVACLGCQTHDRRIYSIRRDKDLHVTDPFAPSTTKAADEATQSLGAPGPGGPAVPPPSE